MVTLQAALVKLAILLSAVQVALAASTAATYTVLPPAHMTAAQVYDQVPVLRPIAACESMGDASATPRQFNADGSILWGMNASGTIVQRDCGEGQINTWVHGRYPNGLDVCGNEDDNVYEMYLLYKESGTKPWNASKASCWAK